MPRDAQVRAGMSVGSIAEAIFLVALIFLVAAIAGCASPAEAYVKADRAKYDFFAPQIEKWTDRAEKAGEIDSTMATINRMNLRSWEDRIREAEGAPGPVPAPAPAPAKPVPPTATAEPAPARRDDPPAPAAPGGPVW